MKLKTRTALITCLLVLTGAPAAVLAAEQAGCDANTMNILQNKALAEGSQDTAYHQALVKQNDSGLEYSCFLGQMIDTVADNIAKSFTETDVWADRPVELRVFHGSRMTSINFELGPDAMNEALEDSVIKAADLVVGRNFGETYIGGYADGVGGGVGCGQMQDAWLDARDHNPHAEHFFKTQSELISYDPRDDRKHP